MAFKESLKKLTDAITKKEKRTVYLAILGFYDNMSDEDYLKKQFKNSLGYVPDFKNPKTYNEKLQWIKLNDRNPLYTTLVDKASVKDYVAEKIGSKYIIPTLGVWNDFDEIDFDKLPNQFVLKTTHDSGGVVICKDKAKFDKKGARKKIIKSFKRNYYYQNREWPYKDVKPRIIAEEFITDLGKDGLCEYKIFCFNGEPKIVLLCKGEAHGAGRTNDYCDLEYNRLPFVSVNPNSEGEIVKPKEHDEIIEIAKKLSQGFPQVRVDTYVSNGKIYFGELTFFHNSGFSLFEPKEWDKILGDYITLPERRK